MALAVVGAELLWLLGANLFLNTPLAPWIINRRPEKWQMTWDHAYSLYPARVQASNVHYSQHTRRVDVEVGARSATTRIGLLPLLGGTLEFRDLAVEGLSVSLNRQVAEDGSDLSVGGGPEATPRVTEKTSDLPHPSDRGPGLRLAFPGITVSDVERFVYDDLEVSGGRASVTADFAVRVRSDISIHDARLRWDDAVMSLREENLADDIDLWFEGDLGPFDPRQVRGTATLAQLTGSLDVSGAIGTLVPLQLFFEGAKWIERLDGSGDIDAHLELDRGKLHPGTKLDVTARGLELDFLGFSARGEGRVGAQVGEGHDERVARVEVAFDSFLLVRGEGASPLAEGEGLTLIAEGPELTAGSLEGTEVTLDLPYSSVPDVTFLNTLIPEGLGVAVSRGRADFGAHIEFDGTTEEAQGEIGLRGTELAGSFRDMTYRLDLALSTQVSGRDLDDFEIELQGTSLKLENGRFESEYGGIGEGWWMTIEVPKGRADLTAPLGVRADVDLSMQDTRAVVALFAEIKHWLRYVKNILTVSDVEGSAVLGLQDGVLSIRGIELTGERLKALGELRVEGKALSGIVWLKYGVLGLALDRTGAETDWKLIKAREWFDERQAVQWPPPAEGES